MALLESAANVRRVPAVSDGVADHKAAPVPAVLRATIAGAPSDRHVAIGRQRGSATAVIGRTESLAKRATGHLVRQVLGVPEP